MFFSQRFFACLKIGLALRKLLLLVGLMFRRQAFLDLALNFRVLFCFSLLFLTRKQSDDRNNGWEYKKFLHGYD